MYSSTVCVMHFVYKLANCGRPTSRRIQKKETASASSCDNMSANYRLCNWGETSCSEGRADSRWRMDLWMCVARSGEGLPSWPSCSDVRERDDGSARVAMLVKRCGEMETASTVELALLCRECSEEHRSCESEWNARGDMKSVSGAETPSFARSDSGTAMVALDGASARAGL